MVAQNTQNNIVTSTTKSGTHQDALNFNIVNSDEETWSVSQITQLHSC